MADSRLDAFISYSSEDRSIARRLANDLSAAGIDVWFDPFQLKAGDPVLNSLRSGIEGADVLLVLISRNSILSTWVNAEVRYAFEKNGTSGTNSIIPVLIDDTKPPEYLRSNQYVDLKRDYSKGLNKLLEVLHSRDLGKLRNDIDAAGLAEELSKDRDIPRGIGFYITTFLSVLTLIGTFIAAIPAFQQTFGDRSRLYYCTTLTQLVIPESLDAEKIRKMLKNEGVADSNLRVTVINRGGRDADEIKIGVDVMGKLAAFNSSPDASSNPVWVSITPPSIKSDNSNSTWPCLLTPN